MHSMKRVALLEWSNKMCRTKLVRRLAVNGGQKQLVSWSHTYGWEEDNRYSCDRKPSIRGNDESSVCFWNSRILLFRFFRLTSLPVWATRRHYIPTFPLYPLRSKQNIRRKIESKVNCKSDKRKYIYVVCNLKKKKFRKKKLWYTFVYIFSKKINLTWVVEIFFFLRLNF